MTDVIEISDNNFQTEVLGATKPVLVDFWAPGCVPCRAIGPMIEELAADNSGRIKVGKMNVAENPRAAVDYGISSVPTLMIFRDGQVVEQFMGIQPKDRLEKAIDLAVEGDGGS